MKAAERWVERVWAGIPIEWRDTGPMKGRTIRTTNSRPCSAPAAHYSIRSPRKTPAKPVVDFRNSILGQSSRTEPQRVADDADRRQRHRRGGDGRRQQESDHRIEDA